jgi:dihydrofolate synthase/folylpolyglutamate synthase
MDYLESVAYIESLAPTILNPSLARFAAFMEAQGQPQDRIPSIHVAGTNGKGSTVAIIDSVLRQSGLKVGRFTGPHLLRWNERFHFAGQPISDADFASYATVLRQQSQEFGASHPDLGALTWFEFLTAMAFSFFRDRNVDVGVYEVGLGGRWDATNVLTRPLVSAITTIALDHTHILGKTIPEIAREKAGIIKHHVPIVTGTQAEALQVIRQRAVEMDAPFYSCSAPDVVSGPTAIDLTSFDASHGRLSLPGQHQQLNALVAYAALALAAPPLKFDLNSHLVDGFAKVYWPGRLQYLAQRGLIMDGAHNVAGAAALRRSLGELFPGREFLFVLGFFQNKDVSGAIEQLVRHGDTVFAGQVHASRSVFPAEEVAIASRARGATAKAYPTIAAALDAAMSVRKGGQLIVAAGSLATVKETMVSLGWHTVEDGIGQTEDCR